MTIAFEQVPSDVLTPFTFVEFSSAGATRNLSGSQPYKTLVIGQKLASGSAPINRVLRVTSEAEAAKLFGLGSMLHHQFRYLKRNNSETESYAIALSDPGQDSDRTFKLSLSGAAANETTYKVTLRKGDQTKKVEFRSDDSATVAKVLNGLKKEADKVDIVSSTSIASSKLSIRLDAGWGIDNNSQLSIEQPSPETGRATGSFNISGPATSDGVLSAYIGDRGYRVSVRSGDTAEDIVTALSEKVNEDNLSYLFASPNGVSVTLTAKHRGLVGEAVPLHFNYLATDSFPDGLEDSTVTVMTGGVDNPDLEVTLEAIDENQYNVIAMPYSDQASLSGIHQLLEKRWGPTNPLDGHAFVAIDNNLNSLAGIGLNSRQVTILDAEGIPTPSYLYTAALAGLNAKHASIDPALPQQTLEVLGVWASKKPRKRKDRDALLKSGISTHRTNGNRIFVERLVTTYTMNPLGAKDISYRDVAVKQTLSFIRWDFINHFNTRYARFKLAKDGTYIAPGQPILTPKTAKAEAISRFKKWEERGLVEGIDQFKRELIVEISPSDPNRLSFYLPTDLVNQLRVIGAQIAFLL